MSFLSNLLRPKTTREKAAALDLAMFNLSLVGEAQDHIDGIQNELGMTERERNAFWQSNYSPTVYASIKANKQAKAPLTKSKHGFLIDPPAKPKTKPQAKAAPRPTPTATAPVVSPLAELSIAQLVSAATHRSAPAAGKPAATAELARRGITVSEDGRAISRSQVGGRADRLANLKTK
jgi:hypothetical protein